MTLKRYIIELGTGADLHGQDVTKAAQKAVKDAISRSCLCGVTEIMGLQDLNKMFVQVTIAAPYPDKVGHNEVLAQVPFGKKTIDVTKGGMEVAGMFVPQLGDAKDSIVVVNAAVEVSIEVD